MKAGLLHVNRMKKPLDVGWLCRSHHRANHRGDSPTKNAGGRPTITIRLEQPQWEKLKKLAIDERTTIQEIVETGVKTEFQKRGLRW
jgi:hypothetical protein